MEKDSELNTEHIQGSNGRRGHDSNWVKFARRF